MCTVLFIPSPSGYFLSSNRDEDPSRGIDTTLQYFSENNYEILSPISLKALNNNNNRVSWIAANHKQSVFILLNGGFVNHVKKPNYRASRGTIIEDIVSQRNPLDFLKKIDLDQIEPFRLVIVFENLLYEFIWTGNNKYFNKLPNTKPYIWSSATLYSPDIKQYRTQLFENYLNNHDINNYETLLDFFNTYINDENGFLLNRNNLVKTISISMITIEPNSVCFEYKNLLNTSLNKTLNLPQVL
ncbi:MAG: hypothetical protein QM539_01135 [Alphaproteobacteria bacterium]|nr:hypothetical protein [Alphaproteobacteria bacterium]